MGFTEEQIEALEQARKNFDNMAYSVDGVKQTILDVAQEIFPQDFSRSTMSSITQWGLVDLDDGLILRSRTPGIAYIFRTNPFSLSGCYRQSQIAGDIQIVDPALVSVDLYLMISASSFQKTDIDPFFPLEETAGISVTPAEL